MGTQYRSAIYYHSPEQKTIAEQSHPELESEHDLAETIVTEVTPFQVFYPAEAYHQEYFKRNPYQGYCMAVSRPRCRSSATSIWKN